MVSVIGKEMVPYDTSRQREPSSQSSSSSIVIDSSPPTEEENSNAVARLSDFINSSDSDQSLQETIANKPRKLDLLDTIEDIDEVDPECVKEILEDHKNYPPQHRPGDPEENPATREKLNYFLKVLELKIVKYSKLANCRIPQSLKNIPIALSYETFITLYWPGAMSCCKKLYKSSHKYSAHYYKQHVPQIKIPSPSLNLGCISATPPEDDMNETETVGKTSTTSQLATAHLYSDNSSDIVSLPDEFDDKSLPTKESVPNFRQAMASQSLTNRPSTSGDFTGLVARKRKTLSPSSRPGPLSYKQPKLNHTIATIDSSVESGDERSSSRPKRTRKRCSSHEALGNKTEEQMGELERDQMKYEPQHEPGAPENFIATSERLRYFAEVLALKLGKYGHLNIPRQASSSTHIPLALSLAGFVQYYWPGKVICCGLVRDNSHVLEKHINRSHRPPKPGPSLAVVTPQIDSSIVNDAETDSADIRQTKISTKSEVSDRPSSKSPPGFQADQHKFPPQHKPGEPEDFCANQESIDYFVEVLTIKREKYASIVPIKEKPLSSNWTEFVLHYWPGMMDCCGHIFTSCKEFQAHFTSSHLPPKKIPCPKIIDPSTAIPGPALKSEVPPPPIPSVATSPVSSLSPSLGKKRSRDQLAIESATSRNVDSTSQLPSRASIPSHLLMINSIQEEARKLRSQTALVMTVSALLPLLERLLELSGSIANRIRGAMEPDTIPHALECLEYVWHASKVAIVRWEDLKGRSTRDPCLSAVQYAYGTLPVFTNWEQSKHLEMLEHVVLLTHNAVKNWQPPPSSPEANMAVRQSSIRRQRSIKAIKTADVVMSTIQEPSEEKNGPTLASTSSNASTSVPTTDKDAPNQEGKEKTSNALLDFCRLANISTWHNTKARSATGYRDDNGDYHAMYRYGIGKAINLYCPPDVTHLRCCGKVFDLARLKTHVMQCHEANGQSNRTEPSISPVWMI
ncbi:uncharacterized protein LOC130701400 isoform X2 [Daphnia carinata]|uniref:uncharacterized protein LOC130701400 isoform X2 n=1 Tax=Daphnia carinata TaxID=120202 RepID=UPI002579DB9D|nr:uncharacterized protein LOC130701400 isoform X2 [Daphnia carinata]